MRHDFTLGPGVLAPAAHGEGNVVLYARPTEADTHELLAAFDLDEHALASALDPDEISRIEYEAGSTFIVWKRPDHSTFAQGGTFTVSSVGMLLESDRLTLVVADDASPLDGLHPPASGSLHELVLHVMRATIVGYLAHIKAMKHISREVQAALSRAMENRQLLLMFDLSEALVYYVDAIDANGGVLARLRAAADRLRLTAEERELLEDIAIDNQQCSRQGRTFTTVLAGMLDARGNLINNNMNVLLKNLTIINVVFLPLGVLAGVAGASELTMMLEDYGVAWQVGYPAFLGGLAVLGLLLWGAIVAWVRR
jgi:magnesium transporter